MQNNTIPERVLFVGFGCIGQALLPLLLREFSLRPAQVRLLAADAQGMAVARQYGVSLDVAPLTPENLASSLNAQLDAGDWLIHLSVDVSSVALIQWCQAHGVLYLDTCVEPWPGGYDHARHSRDATNYALRQQALQWHQPGAPTAVIAHGANPGLITHLANAGLAALAKARGIDAAPTSAATARALGVKVVQIAERDSQWSLPGSVPSDVFVNTWSVPGFLSEAQQPAELGWGTHERTLPTDGMRHPDADASALYLRRPGIDTIVKSWVPSAGEQAAYLIAHHEATSLAAHLTVPAPADKPSARPAYRPTVYYAYQPAPATVRSIARWNALARRPPERTAFLRDSLLGGDDELGVLFIGDWGAFWYGSTLSLGEARALAPHCSATSLQVVAGMLGALRWMQRHPAAGVVEAETMDSDLVLSVAMPYLGDVNGVLTDWMPSPHASHASLQFADFLVEDASMDIGKPLEESVS